MNETQTGKQITPEQFAKLLKKIEEVKKERPLDLSSAEDLSVGIMNLISLEEHFFFTATKTNDSSYHDISGEIREMRKSLMSELIPKEKYEGETWCAVKHLLSATMRFIEVGGKYRRDGNKEASDRVFENAYRLYSIFWALKLRLIEGKKISAEAKEAKKAEAMTLDELTTRLANCCEE